MVLGACSDSSDSEDHGSSDITAVGNILYGGTNTAIDAALTRSACERLGSLIFRSPQGHVLATFVPGSGGVSVGTFDMQYVDDGRPTGWLNTGMPSLITFEGTTEITSVTASEVRGTITWRVALPPGIGQEPDTTLGTVQMTGMFRAVRPDIADCQ
jgi:hypothetical protein